MRCICKLHSSFQSHRNRNIFSEEKKKQNPFRHRIERAFEELFIDGRKKKSPQQPSSMVHIKKMFFFFCFSFGFAVRYVDVTIWPCIIFGMVSFGSVSCKFLSNSFKS